ncbi:tumor necrosis factor receptor superfamily member 16-like isoform X2 [Ahaetulla prasina]|uniref:tumor necrosis factor receptor superfamily member 16-like isoform X2 n=1 Tax=Ahaetulla prasina TaxID=499056 RepID=UPI0026493614|nr:tumor necrosis factor receptor superfamily member 16-like isoform X2 [Ahaetulla prasina]
MAEAMGMMAWLAALILLRKVESPPLWAHCEPGEFPYSGICCKLCPAGTHVEEFCTIPHTLGTCEACIDGENYTAYDNRLEHCLPCIECKSGFKMIAPCTSKKKIECQCNDGYFCPPGCEECVKCKRCPKGQGIIESCNATTDTKCGPPYPGKEESTDHLIPDNNENVNSTTEATVASQDRLPETAERENLEMGNREQEDYVLPNRPSVPSSLEVVCSNGQSSERNDVQSSNKPAVRFKASSMETLDEAYFQTKDIVGPDYWNTLMRKCGLSHNDMQSIEHDYAQHSDEQRYQMLRTLRDRNGVVEAFDKIFAALQKMKLNGIYENLINELKSKGLIIKETED